MTIFVQQKCLREECPTYIKKIENENSILFFNKNNTRQYQIVRTFENFFHHCIILDDRSMKHCYYSYNYHPAFPSFMRTATSQGSLTPLNNNSVYCLTGSMQTSNGKQQTYQLAQKDPTGHAKKISAKNQMIAHNTFIFQIFIF